MRGRRALGGPAGALSRALPGLALLALVSVPAWASSSAGAAAKRPRPDLVVSTIGSLPDSVEPGGSFRAVDTTRNIGRRRTLSSTTGYYLSSDRTRGEGDSRVGQHRVGPLRPLRGFIGAGTVDVPSSLEVGPYYLIACADDLQERRESKERNNCRASSDQVNVRKNPPPPPPPEPPPPTPSNPPPAPTIDSHPNDPTNATNAAFTFSDIKPSVSFLCKLDGGAFQSCTSPKNYAGPLGEGAHTFSVKARSAGKDSTVTSFGWTVDVTAPAKPSIDSHPDDPTEATSASFTFSDTDSGISFLCKLDAGAFSTCTSPKDYLGPLDLGDHTFAVKASDAAGNDSDAALFDWTIVAGIVSPPTIDSGPADPTNKTKAKFEFSGGADLTFLCKLDTGDFAECTSPQEYDDLEEGLHTFSVKAKNADGDESAATQFNWHVDVTPPPDPTITSHPDDPSDDASPDFTFSDAEAGVTFLCKLDTNPFAECTSPKAFPGIAEGAHTFKLKARDAAGNESGEVSFGWTANPLPPDPLDVASAIDPTIATPFADSTAFLYTGDNPIQTGVTPGTIKARRATVLRGTVLKLDGNPLSGVAITIVGHPEFSETRSRADGAFDMAVNGGALVTVRYEKQGFVTAERSTPTDWQDFALLPDVRLIPYDEAVTEIDLTAGGIKVARGSEITDDDGTRRATLLFKPDTAATMTLPNGSTQPLTNLHIRATEYTVGENGEEAMPAELPPTSAYTYAVEFSVDEALAADTVEVSFDKPIASYTENFLDFPVGMTVPVGSFDRATGRWVPERNGLVVKILSITDGKANLDLDGSGNPAAQPAYDALGITDAERAQLASLYSAGQTLWRSQVDHFSPWDYNWPYGLPPGARGPDGKLLPQDPLDDPCRQGGGSTVECQNQTLADDVRVAGTPFSLHYQSDRVPGRKDFNSKTLQVLGSSVPPNLEAITVVVRVSGQQIVLPAPVAPNSTVSFIWNGKDIYGRTVQGEVPLTARISFQYPAVYKKPAEFTASFGGASGSTVAADRTRGKIFLGSAIRGTVGAVRATPLGEGLDAGGWSLDVHHLYDARPLTLYRGDGPRVSAHDSINQINTVAGGPGFGKATELAQSPSAVAVRGGFAYVSDPFANVIRRVDLATGDETVFAGTGDSDCTGDGGPATMAELANPGGLAFDADGNLYFADDGCTLVRRINASTGIITTVAGTGDSCFPLNSACGDGGQATAAKLNTPEDVAVDAAGNVYIADGNLQRVRRVDATTGIITNFAGSGSVLGDGGPATSAKLSQPHGVAVDGDGNVYIADTLQHRIRKVIGGTINTIAGTGVRGTTGDGGSATAAQIDQPWDVIVDAGDVYFSQAPFFFAAQSRVRKISGGNIDTVAGKATTGFSGDGGPAVNAELSGPKGLAMDGGTLYLVDTSNARVRVVKPDLTIDTVFGNGEFFGYGGDGHAAVGAEMDEPRGVAFDAAGNLFIADTENDVVRRVDAVTGVITNFAGGGDPDDGRGDGLQATDADLDNPVGVAVDGEGNVYIADLGDERVRKVDTEGKISTFAGGGSPDSGNGDGGPATEAELDEPNGVATDPEGNLFIVDPGDDLVRKVDASGQITSVAGGGSPAGNGDGGPATAASLDDPEGIAVDRLGNIYIGETGDDRVRKVDTSGIINTYAGTGVFGFSGDGGPATSARLGNPSGVAVDAAGDLFIADRNNERVRVVDSAGTISTYAGNPPNPVAPGFSGDGGGASGAELGFFRFLDDVSHLAVSPDGRLTIADTINGRVRQIAKPLPGFDVGDRLIPSGDGSDLYVFSGFGRHLRTLDAVTGDTIYTFGYDSAGRLTTVTDLDGQVTTIERLADGTPTKIVAPGGQETELTVNGDGFLSKVSDPGGHDVLLGYGDGGLMTSETDPNGNVHEFEYDTAGRLKKDEDPAGGFLSLTRDDLSKVLYEVTSKTAMDRTRKYSVEQLPAGGTKRINTFPGGAQMTETVNTDGSRQADYPDGTKASYKLSGDPRFGLEAPVVNSLVTKLPSGLTQTQTGTRTATLADPANPLSLLTQTNILSINGRTFTSTYDASTRTLTDVSATGQTDVTNYDSKGRQIEFTNAEGLDPAKFSYDAHGRLSKLEQGVQSWTYTYDGLNRLTALTDAAGAVIQYGYDDDTSRVTKLTTPSGKEYGYVYDANGNRTEVHMPSGAVHKEGYTSVDLHSSYQAPGNPELRTDFNLDRQVTQATLPTGRTVVHTYDPNGRAVDVTTAAATTHIDYADLTERASEITRTPAGGGTAQTLSFEYDGHLLTHMTSGGVAVGEYRYRYDNNFNVVGITLNSEPEMLLTHDADGLVTGYGPFTITRNGPANTPSKISDGTLAQDFTYDSFGRLKTKTTKVGATTPYSVAYTYDNVGRLTKKVDGHTYEYEYDLDGQLTKLKKDGDVAETYTYDVNGNRTSRKLGAADPVATTYDGQDRIISRGGVDYTYDADGYLKKRGDDTFSYSAQGELLSATVGGNTINYAYDGFGRLVARTDASGTEQFLYGNPESPFQPTAIRSPGGTLTRYFYDEDEKLYAFQRGATWFYVATDQVGSPRVVTDTSGVAQKLIDYDGFGAVLSDSNPGFELPIGYAGGISDPAAGLVRFGLRDYEPLAGRWTARDPILFSGAQANLYVYVGNSPILQRDPSGTFCIGGSIFAGIGIGGKLCIDGNGISGCIEAGIGIGASADVDLFGESEITHQYVQGEAKIKGGIGPVKIGAGINGKAYVDKYGCTGGDIKLKGDVGPFAPEAKIYDADKGWFPGKGALKGKTGLENAAVDAAKDSLVKKFGKFGGAAQAKLVAGACFGSKSR